MRVEVVAFAAVRAMEAGRRTRDAALVNRAATNSDSGPREAVPVRGVDCAVVDFWARLGGIPVGLDRVGQWHPRGPMAVSKRCCHARVRCDGLWRPGASLVAPARVYVSTASVTQMG